MLRILAYWLAASVVVAAAWTFLASDWFTDERVPENDEEVRERVSLNRQRLAQQIAEAEALESTNAAAQGNGARSYRRDAVGQRHTES
jgi:hypothetical protein